MRIACLQFAPQVGAVDENISLADDILARADVQDLDLLVLPELAFTGYNFRSLQHINPFLERTTEGITTVWARNVALKYGCYVTAGYPEEVDVSAKWPADPEYYNSTVTVDPEGDVAFNYRKTHLYYTDETWALEGRSFGRTKLPGLGTVATGICMDINPYKFEAPWTDYEFANHVLRCDANLVIISMAWLTRELEDVFMEAAREPDLDTLSYWLARMEPIIREDTEDEIIVVLANRCGVEEDAVYAGTSAVLGLQNGEVSVYGILGRGVQQLLVVDTSLPPRAHLAHTTRTAESDVSTSSNESFETEETRETSLDHEKPPFDEDEIVTPIDDSEPNSPFPSMNRRSRGFVDSDLDGSYIEDGSAIVESESGRERYNSRSDTSISGESRLRTVHDSERFRRDPNHEDTGAVPMATQSAVAANSSSRRRMERLEGTAETSESRPKSNAW